MLNKIVYTIIILLTVGFSYAQEKLPARVTCSGEMIFEETKNTLTLNDDVVIVKDNLRIEADKMVIILENELKDITTIIADGNVIVFNLNLLAYGDKMTYVAKDENGVEKISMPTINVRPHVIRKGVVSSFAHLDYILPNKKYPEGKVEGTDPNQKVKRIAIEKRIFAEEADEVLQKDIAKQLFRFNSILKSEQNEAKARLFAIGMPAVPQLIKAMEVDNANYRWHCEWILKKITGQDFGVAASTSEEERKKIIEKWNNWWNSLPKRN